MKAILINVAERKVEQIDIDSSNVLKSLYKTIGNGCHLVAVPVTYENGDGMFIDDEGYLQENQIGGFFYPDYHTPISGNAVIMGADDDGESVDCKSTVADIERNINWLGTEEMEAAQEHVLNAPVKFISW